MKQGIGKCNLFSEFKLRWNVDAFPVFLFFVSVFIDTLSHNFILFGYQNFTIFYAIVKKQG